MMKFLRTLALVSAAALAAVGLQNLVLPSAAMMWQWSQTASSNTNADPQINWSESMSPSSVNDSARAMMSVTAKWRDDISGLLTTTGTSSAYEVTTNAGNTPATPPTGHMIAIRPNATNVAGATLEVDGGTAFPIRVDTSTAVGNGVLISGSPYTLMFNGTAWLLRDFYGDPYQIPLGHFTYSSIAVSPNSNFVAADGSCISRTTYAAYFAAVGTTYGACDGSTTFGVPDHRGRVPGGTDTFGTAAGAASRMTATGCGAAFTAVGATCGSQVRLIEQTHLPAVAPTFHGGTVTVTSLNTNFMVNSSQITIPNGDGNQASTAFNTGTVVGQVQSQGLATGSIGALGSGTAYPVTQPTLGVYVFVRIF